MAHLQEGEARYTPLPEQRFFGAGIKRKRIQFVPSSSSNLESVRNLPPTSSTSVADRYRGLVLGKNVESRGSAVEPSENATSTVPEHDAAPDDEAKGQRLVGAKCDICHRPIISGDSTTFHQSSIAHQICLQHSHPPSHLDRRRKGLAVLESHGWDPDGRKGLGAEGEGILHPIKAKENPSRAGLGVRLEPARVVPKPVGLDAGKVRLMEKEGKKKAERLREAFYRSEDVVRFLGE